MRMNLTDRLRLMGAAGSSPTTQWKGSSSPPEQNTSSNPKSVLLPGSEIVETPSGPVARIETSFPVTAYRGRIALSATLSAPEIGWQRLLNRTEMSGHFSVTEAIFVDTETTGLERGAGTYAFLIGIGRFQADQFRVRQYMMRDYSEEAALMDAVLAELDRATTVVTFNGKTFDWPLLQTRAIMNRMRLPSLLHLDLLHPARRLWAEVTQSCRLTQLEEEILCVAREGDIPGHLIPYVFFDFVSTGDPAQLLTVLEHNRLDLVSTAALAGYLADAAGRLTTAQPMGEPLPGSDLYGLGRMLSNQECLDESIMCLSEAINRGLPPALREGCYRLLGNLHKRSGNQQAAVAVWEEMQREGLAPIHACIELAKHFEHKAKELGTAKEWTLRALEIVQRKRLMRGVGMPLDPVDTSELEALLHRLERLEAKLTRVRGA